MLLPVSTESFIFRRNTLIPGFIIKNKGSAPTEARSHLRPSISDASAYCVQGPRYFPFIVIFAFISLPPSFIIVSITPSKVLPA